MPVGKNEMPKIKKTSKTAQKKSYKKPRECAETHSLKNLTIFWALLCAAAMMGILGFAYLVPIAKENARASEVRNTTLREETEAEEELPECIVEQDKTCVE